MKTIKVPHYDPQTGELNSLYKERNMRKHRVVESENGGQWFVMSTTDSESELIVSIHYSEEEANKKMASIRQDIRNQLEKE